MTGVRHLSAATCLPATCSTGSAPNRPAVRDRPVEQPAGARVLVWQWGRFGGMPRFAMLLADALQAQPDTTALLSLATGAELMTAAVRPRCDLPVSTYSGLAGFIGRVVLAPFTLGALAARIAALRPDIAICAQPAPLDPLMAIVLGRLRVPYIVLVHDADTHPGDGLPFQMQLQRFVCRRAAAVGALTHHVGERLRAQALAGDGVRPLIRLSHPPVLFDMPPVQGRPAPAHRDRGLRLLMFGRLLAYKGLDLLAGALRQLGPVPGLKVRIVGSGAEPKQLRALQVLPCVTVENRWVPEHEVGALLAWSDALILPYREASQSGVAAAALASGRWVLATRVGGLAEQLRGAERAIMCEPTEASIVAGLRRLLTVSRDYPAVAADADEAWREMAASLMQQIEALGFLGANRERR